MAKQINVSRIEKRKLDELIEFPTQQVQFPTLSEDRLRELADDIRRNGLRQKIEVIPKNKAGYTVNSIIKGHMRRLALLRLGIVEIEVIVRYDLADADAEVIEREFLEDNANRRHHDPLIEIGVALRLIEIGKGCARGKLTQSEEEKARAALCERLKMTDRNVRRYMRVLRTPIEVQEAFRGKKLSLVNAGKVVDLPSKVQTEIARRIRAGEAPRKVLAEYLDAKNDKHRKPNDALISFHRIVLRGLHDLDGRTASVSATLVERMRPDLERARDVIVTLLAKSNGKSQSRSSGDEEE